MSAAHPEINDPGLMRIHGPVDRFGGLGSWSRRDIPRISVWENNLEIIENS
jgi:hypothetical protein